MKYIKYIFYLLGIIVVGYILKFYIKGHPLHKPRFLMPIIKLKPNKTYITTFDIGKYDSIMLVGWVPYPEEIIRYDTKLEQYPTLFPKYLTYNESFFDYDNIRLVIYYKGNDIKIKHFGYIRGKSINVKPLDYLIIRKNKKYRVKLNKGKGYFKETNDYFYYDDVYISNL